MNFISILFSVLIGFSIGLVSASIFKKKNIYIGPNSVDVQMKRYKYKNKRIKLVPKVIDCPIFNYHI